ncbi:MAG: nucleotide exchange factor GrpE [Myxococcota bacterium]
MTEENADGEPRTAASEPGSDETSTAPEQLLRARQDLENELARVRRESDELKERWLRAAADLENYKKRAAREREDVARFGNEALLRDLLPVLDDLDRALRMMAGSDPSTQSTEGLELVRRKFLSQLERHNVTTFEAEGEAFDPGRHEAVQQRHSDHIEAGRVAEELQRGFLIAGRLLRPAMVVVSLGPASGDTEGSEHA